ncbi:MAG: DALR domain-containing protein [Candidatus Paceibacterota bacterium]
MGCRLPGWHIECTAMIFATLGKEIDVHTGGEDLTYTHHNAEIAQAECATGKPYVHYWLHNAHITINHEKFSKSLGNGLTLEDLKAKGNFEALDYRYWLLTSHYRTTANFSYEALEAAKTARARLLATVQRELADIIPTKVHPLYERDFIAALHDDLDTPKAIAVMWELAKDQSVQLGEKLATLQAFNTLLELGLDTEVSDDAALVLDNLPADIQTLVEERTAARIAKNWDEADRLREALSLKGYAVEDTDTGPRISKI